MAIQPLNQKCIFSKTDAIEKPTFAWLRNYLLSKTKKKMMTRMENLIWLPHPQDNNLVLPRVNTIKTIKDRKRNINIATELEVL